VPNTKVDPSIDSRHQHRVELLQQLFAWTFTAERATTGADSAGDDIVSILQAIPSLDERIQSVAPERPLADINKVDLAILRLILWEADTKKTPHKVLVDEGIELAKSFGADSSPKFINAALARLLLDKTPPSQN
jgi:transcription termination factor NusB